MEVTSIFKAVRAIEAIPVNGDDDAASWSSRHFSLANARDDRPSDLPHLLRRVATAIEDHAITADELLDVTVSSEITAHGPWWSATVYWSPNEH